MEFGLSTGALVFVAGPFPAMAATGKVELASTNRRVVGMWAADILRLMKTKPDLAKGAIVVVVPPPVETAANTWIQSDRPGAKIGSIDHGSTGKVSRDEIRKEVSRKVPSRQSARPQERRSQPRSHKAGKV